MSEKDNFITYDDDQSVAHLLPKWFWADMARDPDADYKDGYRDGFMEGLATMMGRATNDS